MRVGKKLLLRSFHCRKEAEYGVEPISDSAWHLKTQRRNRLNRSLNRRSPDKGNVKRHSAASARCRSFCLGRPCLLTEAKVTLPPDVENRRPHGHQMGKDSSIRLLKAGSPAFAVEDQIRPESSKGHSTSSAWYPGRHDHRGSGRWLPIRSPGVSNSMRSCRKCLACRHFGCETLSDWRQESRDGWRWGE